MSTDSGSLSVYLFIFNVYTVSIHAVLLEVPLMSNVALGSKFFLESRVRVEC